MQRNLSGLTTPERVKPKTNSVELGGSGDKDSFVDSSSSSSGSNIGMLKTESSTSTGVLEKSTLDRDDGYDSEQTMGLLEKVDKYVKLRQRRTNSVDKNKVSKDYTLLRCTAYSR
jgi:hypothetical protein